VQIRALLERIGSPLVDSVHVPESRRIPASSVTLTDVSTDGVAAVISGERKTPILLGSVAYLQKYGIRVSPKKGGRYEELCRNMLCVAINNRLTALFIARYRPSEGMESLIEGTDVEGLQLAIRTKDPGIHDALLSEVFADAEIPLRAVKPQPLESDIRTDEVDATVVALGSPLEAARTFAVCRRMLRAIKLERVLEMLAILLGVLLSGALLYFGYLAVVPAFAVVIYNVLWCGIHALSSYLYLRRDGDGE
jgi:hypothetical protein